MSRSRFVAYGVTTGAERRPPLAHGAAPGPAVLPARPVHAGVTDARRGDRADPARDRGEGCHAAARARRRPLPRRLRPDARPRRKVAALCPHPNGEIRDERQLLHLEPGEQDALAEGGYVLLVGVPDPLRARFRMRAQSTGTNGFGSPTAGCPLPLRWPSSSTSSPWDRRSLPSGWASWRCSRSPCSCSPVCTCSCCRMPPSGAAADAPTERAAARRKGKMKVERMEFNSLGGTL